MVFHPSSWAARKVWLPTTTWLVDSWMAMVRKRPKRRRLRRMSSMVSRSFGFSGWGVRSLRGTSRVLTMGVMLIGGRPSGF